METESSRRPPKLGCVLSIRTLLSRRLLRTCEAAGTDAVEGVDGVDGAEEHGRRADERRRVAELEDGDALLEVEARLDHAQVVVERQHLKISKQNSFIAKSLK